MLGYLVWAKITRGAREELLWLAPAGIFVDSEDSANPICPTTSWQPFDGSLRDAVAIVNAEVRDG